MRNVMSSPPTSSAADEGRRPRIMVAKLGQDGHDRGAKVIVVEQEAIGGTCLNWGCIPTKTIKATAEAIEKLHARTGVDIGVHLIFGMPGAAVACIAIPHLTPAQLADPVRLAQVLGNLLNNACKFSERGGRITLGSGDRKFEVDVDWLTGRVAITD